MPLDERPARLDLVSHEDGEYLIGLDHVLDRDLEEGPLLRAHGRLPELVRVHFTQAFIPLDRKPLFPELKHIMHELPRMREGPILALFTDLIRRTVKSQHCRRQALELPELRRSYEILVEHDT